MNLRIGVIYGIAMVLLPGLGLLSPTAVAAEAEAEAEFVPTEKQRVIVRTDISDQDNSGRWMRITFPNLFDMVSPSSVDNQEYPRATWTGISGDRLYQNGARRRIIVTVGGT
jgi:hypothetical protein